MVAKLINVAVVFGGPSPEHDVSILTGLQATRALRALPGLQGLHPIYWATSGAFFEVSSDLEGTDFLQGTPSSARELQLSLGPEGGFQLRRGRLGSRGDRIVIDAALICCHGGPGEDGALQSALDLAGIAYSGPSAASAALGMDKLASGAVTALVGIPALSRIALEADGPPPQFDGPYIVKPRFGGSSIGIEVVQDFATAQALASSSVHLRRGAVLEPYRPDLDDLQIAVRTWPKLELSDIERPLRKAQGGEILNYADKYVGGTGMDAAPRELPASVSEALAEQLRGYAARATTSLGVRGVARVDFLSDGTCLYLNEINTIPGSLSRHMFINPPLAFSQLLSDLLEEAIERPAARFSSAGADGSVLRDAKNIAGKLA